MRYHIVLLLAAVVLMSGCVQDGTVPPTGDGIPADNASDTTPPNHPFESVFVNHGDTVPDCDARGMSGRVIIMHKPGCPACEAAVPILERLEQEMGMDFDFIDVSSDKDRLDGMAVYPYYVPTTIVDCKAYAGAMGKEDYRSLIEAI
jgi:thiol-disulfide isomerase/thioredoxin